ncbi:MAG: YraN family protein [Vampirovibrionales bacterium]|nr:YraN family protein [Vampirovibrionales bacterium]
MQPPIIETDVVKPDHGQLKVPVNTRQKTPESTTRKTVNAVKGHRKRLGALGEAQACRVLVASGYEILERNWRYGRLGELDIVALSPLHAQMGQTLVYIEVKTRRSQTYGSLFETLSTKQKTRLLMLAEAFVAQYPQYAALARRIDLFCISPHSSPDNTHGAPGQYTHLVNVLELA